MTPPASVEVPTPRDRTTAGVGGVAERHRLSVAPMMDWTDRHFRALMRVTTARTLLYTEMLTTGAILHGDRDRLLGYGPQEHPVALQIGGDDPGELAACARIGAAWGYDEINLNVGCPSDRVQRGAFGACLMKDPERVRDGVAAMVDAVAVPVTVKHRIGVDDLDAYEDMANFVAVVAEAGPARFTVHARKAWLSGLSPKENRTVPPLRYDDVYRLKRDFPQLSIEINGGIRTPAAARAHLDRVDAVMIGRGAYEDPLRFVDADPLVYGVPAPVSTRRDVLEAMTAYVDAHLTRGGRLAAVARHLLHVVKAVPGAKAWRRRLTEGMHRDGADLGVLAHAAAAVPDEVWDEDVRADAAPRSGLSDPGGGTAAESNVSA